MGDTLAGGAGAGAPEPGERAAPDRAAARRRPSMAADAEAALRALARRPLPRAALGVVRRQAPLWGLLRRWWSKLRSVGDRAALAAMALWSWPARAGRRAALEREVATVDPVTVTRGVSVIAWSGAGSPWPSSAGLPVERVLLGGVGEGATSADVRVDAAGRSRAAALGLGAAAATNQVLCFVVRPLEEVASGWLAPLVGALGEGVVAATPTVVHAARSWPRGTEHDLLTMGRGVEVVLDATGAPAVLARGAGQPVQTAAGATDVVAAPLQCLVVDRAAYLEAGGIDPTAPDDEVAGIDLCARLRQHGGRVVHVPGAVALDDRPVASRLALRRPVEPGGAPSRWLLDHQGAWLARAARTGDEPRPARWVITTAAPSARVAERWGDWHLAEALARSLRRQGQDVVVQTHDQADGPSARSRDLHLVLRGLAPVRATPGQRQILWVISHPEAVGVDECDDADLVVVASTRFAADLAGRTTTPVEVLLQATDPERFHPHPVDPVHRHQVTVVAKTRDVRRRAVVDALAAGLRPAIYGGGWLGLVDPSLVVADHVDNALLPVVYSSADVVLNDHWDTMREWGFVSNRIYDVLACGTPVISDDVAGVQELFGDAVPTYRTSAELGALVQQVLDDPEAARGAAARGRAVVLAEHTFDRRAEQLLALVVRHGLAPAGS